uniref:Uncharacterized protein n=1 Tax=Rhinolophus ferrumequinum TaxID=59479 RepID=A0A671DK83_RHIFE
MLHGYFSRCYHWGKLCEGYTGILCTISAISCEFQNKVFLLPGQKTCDLFPVHLL